MVLVQKLPFFQALFFRKYKPGKYLLRYSTTKSFYFLGNISQENMFFDILERKNAFLGYKNKKYKKLKNWHFSKGVNPWFWSKNGHFSKFYFLGNISQGNIFYDILQRKNAFLGFKNKKFKKSKNRHFSIGVNPCC